MASMEIRILEPTLNLDYRALLGSFVFGKPSCCPYKTYRQIPDLDKYKLLFKNLNVFVNHRSLNSCFKINTATFKSLVNTFFVIQLHKLKKSVPFLSLDLLAYSKYIRVLLALLALTLTLLTLTQDHVYIKVYNILMFTF